MQGSPPAFGDQQQYALMQYDSKQPPLDYYQQNKDQFSTFGLLTNTNSPGEWTAPIGLPTEAGMLSCSGPQIVPAVSSQFKATQEPGCPQYRLADTPTQPTTHNLGDSDWSNGAATNDQDQLEEHSSDLFQESASSRTSLSLADRPFKTEKPAGLEIAPRAQTRDHAMSAAQLSGAETASVEFKIPEMNLDVQLPAAERPLALAHLITQSPQEHVGLDISRDDASLHICRCGEACSCYGCPVHPYNKTTQAHVLALDRIMEEDAADPQESYAPPLLSSEQNRPSCCGPTPANDIIADDESSSSESDIEQPPNASGEDPSPLDVHVPVDDSLPHDIHATTNEEDHDTVPKLTSLRYGEFQFVHPPNPLTALATPPGNIEAIFGLDALHHPDPDEALFNYSYPYE